MYHYGLLLENFRENGEFVNDCIFTMMHHVSGDLGQPSILFQPNILKTYSTIWESEYSICDVSMLRLHLRYHHYHRLFITGLV